MQSHLLWLGYRIIEWPSNIYSVYKVNIFTYNFVNKSFFLNLNESKHHIYVYTVYCTIQSREGLTASVGNHDEFTVEDFIV